MDNRDQTSNLAAPGTSAESPEQTRASAATCHPDVVCPVCTAKGKTVRMQPIKAHYQCPECRYFDSCCM
jgi:transposase-like protein